jgi:hypothetical protein
VRQAWSEGVKVVDEDALREARNRPACESCGRRVWPLDPHHCFRTRGPGGGSRLDLPCNLIGLCRVCHEKSDGMVFNDGLKAIIAKREGTTVDAIKDYLNLVLRTPKERQRPEPTWKAA